MMKNKKGQKFMNTIFMGISKELKEHRDVMLITIVSKSGSSPRGAGAQMLVGEHGRILGTIGGGAVERRSEEMAQALLRDRRSGDHEFLLRQNSGEDIGMVCGGDVSVLFQFIDSEKQEWKDFTDRLLSLLSSHHPGWLVLHMDGSFPALLETDGREIMGTCAEPIQPPAENKWEKTESYFIMPLPVLSHAVIFGGGHCSQALVPVLSRIGFCVTVMDNRPELCDPKLFPEADEIICGDYLKLSDHIELQASDYVVVMTNGHSHDFEVQEQILRKPLAYVGVIGSQRKTDFINRKLRESGIPEEVISRIHAPIGTKIKAVTPEEIAISIAGEMIYERALLRESRGMEAPHGCPMH